MMLHWLRLERASDRARGNSKRRFKYTMYQLNEPLLGRAGPPRVFRRKKVVEFALNQRCNRDFGSYERILEDRLSINQYWKDCHRNFRERWMSWVLGINKLTKFGAELGSATKSCFNGCKEKLYFVEVRSSGSGDAFCSGCGSNSPKIFTVTILAIELLLRQYVDHFHLFTHSYYKLLRV